MIAGAKGGDSAAGGFVRNSLKVEIILFSPVGEGNDFFGG